MQGIIFPLAQRPRTCLSLLLLGIFFPFFVCEWQCWLRNWYLCPTSVLHLLPWYDSFLQSFTRRRRGDFTELCSFQNVSSQYVYHIHTLTVGKPKDGYPIWPIEATKSSTTLGEMQPKKGWHPNPLENNFSTRSVILCLSGDRNST